MPTSPALPVQPMATQNPVQHFPDALRDALPFSALNGPVTSLSACTASPQQQAEDSYENSSDSLLNALYLDESFSFVEPHLDNDGYTRFEGNYFSSAFDSSAFDGWDLSSSLVDSLNSYDL